MTSAWRAGRRDASSVTSTIGESHSPGSSGIKRCLVTVAAGIGVAAVLVVVIARRRDEFFVALEAAPLVILALASVLQLVALVARTEAWHVCVRAAGATLGRRRLFRAASLGYLGSQLNSHLGAAARIAALRRVAPEESPRVPALIAAEIPILIIEAALAAGASFTVVSALGLPWWVAPALLAAVLAVAAGLRRMARDRHRGFWSGLAVLRRPRDRTRVFALILVAVLAQILRNWLMLHAVGVDASVFDATAVLIAMVILSQLPVGPSVGAAAVVVILGVNGVAATAAAGILLTATGTVGALTYVTWAGLDRLGLQLRLPHRTRPRTRPAEPLGHGMGLRPPVPVAAAAAPGGYATVAVATPIGRRPQPGAHPSAPAPAAPA